MGGGGSLPVENEGEERVWGRARGGVGTGTCKAIRTRLSKLPFGKLLFSQEHKQHKRSVSGQVSCGRPGVIRADVPGQKLRADNLPETSGNFRTAKQ